MTTLRVEGALKSTILKAIQNRNLLWVVYKGLAKVVEPYLLYESKSGDEILHGWQTSGEYDKSPPPDWCNLNLESINAATVLEDRYRQPHPHYNPNSKNFHRVIAFTPKSRKVRSAGR